MKSTLLLCLSWAAAACNASSSNAVPSSREAGVDGAASRSDASQLDAGVSALEAAADVAATADAAQDIDSGTVGGCVVRPACEACIVDAGVCCVYPNPAPPPGPENAIACSACPVDAGPKFVTLTCNDESDCKTGQQCCIEIDGNSNVHTFCAAACDPRQNQYGLCNSNATTSACSTSAACSRMNIDDWYLPHCYGTCGGVAPP